MKLLNKESNFLTDYGFACGYTETRETDFESVRLWKEGGVYQVTGVSYRNEDPFDVGSFEKLKEAKELFFKLCKKYNLIKYKKRIGVTI